MEDIISVEKVAVIANGAVADYDALLPALKGYDQYIAVDGGLHHCAALGVTPLFLVGDMDSVEPEMKAKFPNVKELKFKREKDATDLELALEFLIKKNPRSITIFAGFGDRVDHSLSNLVLLTRYPGKVFLETETEVLGVIDKELELETHSGQTLSLIPMNGPALGITTDGLKWELKDDVLDKSFVGISNEATGTSVLVSLKSGDLLFSIHKKGGF
ncbi:thiamine diphosphokinase [Simkania sp.]|uniref:thiamine diphosphokinase n=1 Tax=Simkania sp. TaxID=34094 RepID=UPI003B51A9D5